MLCDFNCYFCKESISFNLFEQSNVRLAENTIFETFETHSRTPEDDFLTFKVNKSVFFLRPIKLQF